MPRTAGDLKENIRQEIAAMLVSTLQRQVYLCLDMGDDHFQSLMRRNAVHTVWGMYTYNLNA
jgi:hypothetical protein